MTDQQPTERLCQCFLGDGKFLCDTPRDCFRVTEPVGTREVFAKVQTSDAFSLSAAHKAFAGVVRERKAK